jgi:hypothetical protein
LRFIATALVHLQAELLDLDLPSLKLLLELLALPLQPDVLLVKRPVLVAQLGQLVPVAPDLLLLLLLLPQRLVLLLQLLDPVLHVLDHTLVVLS